MKDFLNKDVEILVSFAGGANAAGAVPICYYGKLIKVSEDFITLECIGSRYATNTLLVINPKAYIDSSGLMTINKNFIIYIKEKTKIINKA